MSASHFYPHPSSDSNSVVKMPTWEAGRVLNEGLDRVDRGYDITLPSRGKAAKSDTRRSQIDGR